MKNNIQKKEMSINILGKIIGIRKLTKSQKSDLVVGLDVYLQSKLCGNFGSESWCKENLNKVGFIYFMEYLGKELDIFLNKVNNDVEIELYKLIEDELDLETIFKLS